MAVATLTPTPLRGKERVELTTREVLASIARVTCPCGCGYTFPVTMPPLEQVLKSAALQEWPRDLPRGTGTEEAILSLLLANREQWVSNDAIRLHVWGERPTSVNIIRSNVQRIRLRLAPTPWRIETLNQRGYRLMGEEGGPVVPVAQPPARPCTVCQRCGADWTNPANVRLTVGGGGRPMRRCRVCEQARRRERLLSEAIP